jgi:hypothetical protein
VPAVTIRGSLCGPTREGRRPRALAWDPCHSGIALQSIRLGALPLGPWGIPPKLGPASKCSPGFFLVTLRLSPAATAPAQY